MQNGLSCAMIPDPESDIIQRRFVVLEHDYPFLHWDFLIEREDFLEAWRLLNPPRAGAPVSAESLPDHRRIYLNYEGPVSGRRGSVRRIHAGLLQEFLDKDGVHYAIVDSDLATRCRLIRTDDDRALWQFE